MKNENGEVKNKNEITKWPPWVKNENGKVKNKNGNLNRKAKRRSENQNVENENGKVKYKNGNLSRKAKWRSEKQNAKNKNGNGKNKNEITKWPPGLLYYPLIYHEIKSRIVRVSLTFTCNFFYNKSFLGD